MTTWQEYLDEKQKLVDIQVSAIKQPTPASRLAWYYKASYPIWRLQTDVVNKLDEAFVLNDFTTINDFTYHLNNLVAAIARAMRDEVANRLAVENKELKAEEYQPAWWC